MLLPQIEGITGIKTLSFWKTSLVLGIQIPAIANFELRPNVELFWK
jgi:hypothetical protein